MAGVPYFISDLHLGHKRILDFGQRVGIKTIEEHDDLIIETIGKKVKKKADILWILGDVAMNRESLSKLSRLQCRKRLVLGNHDNYNIQEYLKYFENVYGLVRNYHGLVFSHCPLHPNEMAYRNWKCNVHGHIHHPEKDLDDPTYFNVNVDIIGMEPLSLEELRQGIINKGGEV